jgi:hypothetical protein
MAPDKPGGPRPRSYRTVPRTFGKIRVFTFVVYPDKAENATIDGGGRNDGDQNDGGKPDGGKKDSKRDGGKRHR